MKIDIRGPAGLVAACAAAMISAPTALADQPAPDVPPAPDVVNQAAAATDAPPAAAAPPAADPPVPAAPAAVPHLSSPENLPPGTTNTPINEGPRTSYLRGIWTAIHSQDITWRDGLLMLAQRPMDPGATPPHGIPAGPQAPGPAAPAPETLAPAPETAAPAPETPAPAPETVAPAPETP